MGGGALSITLDTIEEQLLELSASGLAQLLPTLPPDLAATVDAIWRDPAWQHRRRARVYGADPVSWVGEVLDEYLWSRQRTVCQSVVEYPRTAVPSCHGAGKSFDAARIACWWIDAHEPGSAFVVTTAPTGDQVSGVLWREMNRAHARGALPGRMGVKQWSLGNELVAIGRKPADTNPAAFQGLHAPFILVVIDEADGVAEPIFEAASETLAVNDDARILAIGNPDRGEGPFFRACQPGSGWHVIRISAFDTPNLTGEEVPPHVSQALVSLAWVEDKRRKWGEDDPRYSSKVLALPPLDVKNGVIPWSKLRECMARDESLPAVLDGDGNWLSYDFPALPGPVEAGLDVGGGGDLTVLWERRGPVLCRRWEMRDPDLMATVNHAVRWLNAWGVERVKVDATGIGHGVADRLDELRRDKVHNARVDRVKVGEAPFGPDASDYPKLRDQVWWEVGRGNTIDGTWNLSVLDDESHEEVVTQLIEPRWAPDARGRIHVESKAETVKRIGHSPDDADAILLAYYSPPGGRAIATGSQIARTRLPGLR